MRLTIILPFPPASLSGHAKGHWRSKSTPTAKHREWARLATLDAIRTQGMPTFPDGDIPLHVTFEPADRRGDKWNFPARAKASIDGVADALGVNDKRFVPTIVHAAPAKPGRVIVVIG